MATAALQFDAELSKQDTRALMAGMHRARRQLNMPLGKATQFTAWAVADALRTATKVSGKYRPLTQVGRTVSAAGNKQYEVESYRGGTKKTFSVWAKGVREARKLRAVMIARRGLAASAWGWAQGMLGRRGGMRVDGKTHGIARNYTDVTKRIRGEDPMVRIDNRLGYATQAFKGSGEQVLANVMQRAAGRMEHIMDGHVKRALKAK